MTSFGEVGVSLFVSRTYLFVSCLRGLRGNIADNYVMYAGWFKEEEDLT